MTFTQVTARLKNFLVGWLLVLGLKEDLVECATVYIKSWVILRAKAEIGNEWNVLTVHKRSKCMDYHSIKDQNPASS